MMRRPSIISALIALSVVLGAPCAVYSQPAPAVTASADQADALFRQGNAFYKEHQYAEAKAAFEKAFRLKKAHDIAANLGYAEMKLNLFRDAAEHISFAVRIWPPTGKDDKRQYAVDRFAIVKRQVVTLTVQVNVRRAEVFVDGKSIGVAPLEGEVFVEPGSRTIEAKLAGYADAKQVIEGGEGAERTVSLNLKASTTVPPALAASTAEPIVTPSATGTTASPPPSGSVAKPQVVPISIGPRPEIIVGGAVLGAAGIGAGIALLAVSGSKGSDADSLLGQMKQANVVCTRPPQTGQCQDLVSLRKSHDTLHNAAIPIVITGGVIAAGTVVYALWPRSKSERDAKVRLLPVVGPSRGGLWVSGSF